MLRFPPKKILVPFDLSDVSLSAWPHAAKLAKRFRASVDILYVQELLPLGEWPSRFEQLDAELKREITAHIRSKIGNTGRIHVMEGDPVLLILKLARALRPDMVVMGTHGRSGVERLFSGSVAEDVVRMSPAPVMAARGSPRDISSILVPVNFTSYGDHAFAYAAGVAAAFESELTVLHVAADAAARAQAHRRIADLIAQLAPGVRKICRPEAEVVVGKPTEAILEAAGKHGLLVLAAHRKPLLKDLVLGMTAERIIRHSPIPVLTVPSPKQSLPHDARRTIASVEKALEGKIF